MNKLILSLGLLLSLTIFSCGETETPEEKSEADKILEDAMNTDEAVKAVTEDTTAQLSTDSLATDSTK